MKLTEIAARIDAHLKRFEADKEINKARGGAMKISPYYHAGSWSGGRFVYVRYVSFQNSWPISKSDAEKYLSWLDDGNVGRHYEALK